MYPQQQVNNTVTAKIIATSVACLTSFRIDMRRHEQCLLSNYALNCVNI